MPIANIVASDYAALSDRLNARKNLHIFQGNTSSSWMEVQRIAEALIRPTFLQCRMSFLPTADIRGDAMTCQFSEQSGLGGVDKIVDG